MQSLSDQPILTDTYVYAAAFEPLSRSLYIYALTAEDRTHHVERWLGTTAAVPCEISRQNVDSFSGGVLNTDVPLRGTRNLSRFLGQYLDIDRIYIDITGLIHPVWAALLRSALETRLEVLVVYAEPERYSRSRAPIEGQLYDLSEKISGIAPMPGFAVLSEPNDESHFVPLLGFEGTRLRYLIEETQPAAERIIPFVGLPGFKPNYVFETYLGNYGPLNETGAWQQVRYIPADCPFRCFYALQEIARENPRSTIKIALIGTKPHALGAVLFALSSMERAELIYDHPLRQVGRTTGTEKVLVYHVASIVGGLRQARRHRQDNA